MATFWAFALGLALSLYVLLDGFDLGVGILFAFAPNERARRHMMQAVSPVWDGNETWLVVSGGVLFGAFPAAYAILVGAFYLPVIVMLCGLILRGVAFEFREKAQGMRWFWSGAFGAGSIVAAFAQGTTIGAFVQELPVHDGKFTGSVLTWLSPYALWCGLGLVLGYALLGACWLVHKTHADVRAFGYRAMPVIGGGLVVFLAVAAIAIFAMHLRIADQWFDRPWLLAFVAVGLAAGVGLAFGWWKRIDRLPLPMAMTMFAAAFSTMVFALLPYMVPFSLTIEQAAAPHATLAFLFWGAGIVIYPITLIYTGVVYWIFRGRIEIDDDDDDGPGAGTPSDSSAFDSLRSMVFGSPTSADLERRADKLASALSDTLEALQERLSPKRAVGRLAQRFVALRSPAGVALGLCPILLVVAVLRDRRRRRLGASDPVVDPLGGEA